jgi:formate hydrogenlyase subunit 4
MLNIILLLLSVMLVPGTILRTKSLFSGRKGPGFFQPLRDVRVLALKGNVISSTTSIIFRIAPTISLATVVCAMLFIPVGRQAALLSFSGDFIFFAYLLALGRFMMIIAALDTGSSFEGMGANREALYGMLAEPALLLLMGTFAMFTGHNSLSGIFTNLYFNNSQAYLIGITGMYLLGQIAMVENSRLPIDDPKTHLELTMVHEVMILDYSGIDLAMIHLTTWIKFAIFGALISNSVVPAGWPLLWQILLFVFMQVVVGATIGFLESFRARNKMMKNPKFILTLTAVAFVVFVYVLFFSKQILEK